jgi:hypothetical protein
MEAAQQRGAEAIARMEADMGTQGELARNNANDFGAAFGDVPTQVVTQPVQQTARPVVLPARSATTIVTTDFTGRAVGRHTRGGGRGRGRGGRGRGARESESRGRGGRTRGGRGRGNGGRASNVIAPHQHQQQITPLPQPPDLFFDEAALEAEIHDTFQARIAPKSRTCYIGYITRMIKFFFDYRHVLQADVIKQDLLQQLITAHEQDITRVRSDGKPYKRRIHVDACIKSAITNIRADDESTHPLHLGNLSFKIVAFFMNETLKKEISLPEEDDVEIDVEEGFDDGDAANDETYSAAAGAGTIKIHLKAASFDGVQSAIANLYTDCNFDRDFNETTKEFWRKIGLFRKGTRRKGARERQKLGLRTVEGKDPMPHPAYVYLANVLHKSKDPKMIACHLFLLLEWNLISRADFVIEQNIEIIGLFNDAIRFEIGVTKTDQEGSKHRDHPAHVYACPENPVICPVLAFGKYLACNPRILKGNCPLFEGSNQYNRFNNILRDIVTSEEQ